ncbi:MAG: LysM peptidoglycan-binding domain-containing protein [Gammaproteobacteria bacterium]|nr:MAG: LysM peptidoglycan-binding domain-containing protein [Gammaproteobacteria bacterium]
MNELPGTQADPDSDQTSCPRQWPARIVVLALLLALLAGCASQGAHTGLTEPPAPATGAPAAPRQVAGDTQAARERSPLPLPETVAKPEAPPDPWQRLRGRFAFTSIEHPRIDHELQRLRRHPPSLSALLQRMRRYLPLISEAVERQELPGEIALLPAVESGFDPYAYSPYGAVGLWQFMPATARIMGLAHDRWYDGRRDLIPATRAALRYLVQLRQALDGNWLHALAAYNCGIGTVKKAMRKARHKGRSTSYWALDLPAETDAYVPRLIALAKIIEHPRQYGVELPELDDRPRLQTAEVHGSLDLEIAARLAQIPLEELLALNPAYRRGVTPPGRTSRLLLPEDRKTQFETALAALPRRQWLRWAEHRIARGDTLGKIARHYKVTIAAIREANGLHGDRIRAGRTLRIPLSGKAADVRRGLVRVARRKVHYRVRRGDSLYAIARRFSVSIRDLRRWNRVGRYIRPGQRLTVYVKAG